MYFAFCWDVFVVILLMKYYFITSLCCNLIKHLNLIWIKKKKKKLPESQFLSLKFFNQLWDTAYNSTTGSEKFKYTYILMNIEETF